MILTMNVASTFRPAGTSRAASWLNLIINGGSNRLLCNNSKRTATVSGGSQVLLRPPSFSTSTTAASPTTTTTNNSGGTPPSYTLALTRAVPSSFPNAITKYASSSSTSSSSSIDFARAQDQHAQYVEQLQAFVPNTITLPPLDRLADSVFVEDCVVVCDQTAIMTRPGHADRRPEVYDLKRALREREHGGSTNHRHHLTVGDMNVYGPDVICDGGDVLYTGRHLFVGLSQRTSQAAVDVLREAFGFSSSTSDSPSVVDGDPLVQVVAVPFADDALHLKSIVTAVDDWTLLAPLGKLGDDVLKTMGASEKGYHVTRLPSMLACNVIAANGGLLAQDTGCAISKKLLEKLAIEKNLDLRWVDCSEFAKCDGALTCCSVLLNV